MCACFYVKGHLYGFVVDQIKHKLTDTIFFLLILARGC